MSETHSADDYTTCWSITIDDALDEARCELTHNSAEGAQRALKWLDYVRGRLNRKTQFTLWARLFGKCLYIQGDYAAAVAWLRKGDPGGLLLADALFANGEHKKAAQLYRNLVCAK